MGAVAAPRRKLLITGAAGGMGRACARLLGMAHDLVLTDAAAALDDFAGVLAGEGYTVTAAHRGDLCSPALLAALMRDMESALPPLLIHTAGLSPSLAGAEAIMTVNLIGTVKLLDAMEPILRPGAAAVLIASSAGHLLPPMPAALALMEDPLAADFGAGIMALIQGAAQGEAARLPGIAYALSKQAVLALTRRRALAWGRRGARLVSISPGMILTDMGRAEAKTPGGAMTRDASPLGRAGTPADIALAAQFLCSDAAGFITGCDLLVDGGSVAALRAAR